MSTPSKSPIAPIDKGPTQMLGESAFSTEGTGQLMAPPAFQLMAAQGSDAPPSQQKDRSGGMPSDLVNGFATTTGHDLSGVKVHYNSDKPAEVGALAYAQSNEIHLGAGQEHHLAHEAAHVVQQREGRVKPTTEVNGMPVNDNHGLESEADHLGAKAAQMKSAGSAGEIQRKSVSAAAQLKAGTLGTDIRTAQPGSPTQSPMQGRFGPIQRVAAPITGVAASVSWINPSSPAGGMVPDPAPANQISRGFIAAAQGFRFANHVAATITSEDGRTIDRVEHDDLQLQRGPSFAGIDSHAYPVRRTPTRGTEGGVEYLQVNQVVGARTVSHERIGGGVGAGVGAGVGILGGAFLGAKAGAAAGTVVPGWGNLIGGVLGAVAGGAAGYYAGRTAGAAAMNFPPIWTDVTLRIYADGRINRQLNRHSLFPCVHFYGAGNYLGGPSYNALATEQTAWENGGWGGGNPWGVNRYDGN